MGVRRKKTLLEKAQEVAEQVTDQVVHAAHDGLEKAAPLVEKATEKATPLVERAGEKAAPLVERGRELAVEKAAAGAALAATAAAAAKTGAHDVQDRVTTLVDDAKPAPKKKGKFKKFLLLSLLAGAAAFAVKKLTGGKEADKWQSSYTPPPAPTPVPKAAPAPPAPAPAATAQDSAGADPAEALADAAEEPHRVTTPDKPAEEIELEKESETGDVTADPLPASDEPAPEFPGRTGKTLE